MTPAKRTRDLISEVLWWHNAIGIRDDAYHVIVTIDDVLGRCRKRHIVRTRHDCMARVRGARPELSYPKLGRLFNRDHSTILHALGRLTKRNVPKWKSLPCSQISPLRKTPSELMVSP